MPRPDLGRTTYDVVERDGRRVLHALAADAASGLRCDVDIDPTATPWFQWEWRTRIVDPRASVADFDLDDSPARVALGFEGDISTLPGRERVFGDLVYAITGYMMPFATLMYVWDAPRHPPEACSSTAAAAGSVTSSSKAALTVRAAGSPINVT